MNIALFNTLLEMTPDKRKTTFTAYFYTAVTVSIAAPLFGVGPLNVMEFRAAFLTAAGIRILGSLVYLALARREHREDADSSLC